MIIGIHQPNFLPWNGFFQKLSDSDIFVILDDVQFSKGSYTNRVKILRKDNSWFWLTMPIENKNCQLIKNIRIKNFELCKKKIIASIKNNCSKLPESFYEIFDKNYQNLIDFNMAAIEKIIEIQQIKKPKIIFSSDLNLTGSKSELILNIVKELKGTKYIAGGKTNKYLDLEEFEKNNIQVEFIDYSAYFNESSALSIL